MLSVHLEVSCDSTSYGEQVAVLGSWNNWDKSKPTILETSSTTFPVWQTSLSLPSAQIEYKYAIVQDSKIIRWENESRGLNRILHVTNDTPADIRDVFGKIPDNPDENQDHANQEDSPPHPHFKRTDVEITLRDVETEGLDDLERAVVKVTAERKSWRQRLAFIRALLTDSSVASDAAFDKSNVDHLATLSVYLTFLSTGQVRCDEDGGHYRPDHHAREARKLELALATLTANIVEQDTRGKHAYVPYVARKIFPLLPSYSSQFTVNVPLTRIRDIAHRNDIPRDLKQEIKHRLQNKLHRCAGPEDLQTSQQFLDRINAGNYSEDFTEQYRIFHEELRAFFNAASTEERLNYLQENENTAPVAELAGRLLTAKRAKTPALEQLDVLSELRSGIADLPLMQIPDDENDELPSEDTQKARLADIDLENYAFLLLASVAKEVEEQNSSDTDKFDWSNALMGLTFALCNIALSCICPEEANAAANELAAAYSSDGKLNLLRVKAAVDRASRFAANFSSVICDVYDRRVSTIGKALKVEEHAMAVFAEAEIRSNITFHASRIANACRQVCRNRLSLPPWDPLYAGEASGKLVHAEELGSIKTKGKEPVIAVCRSADGDEDIPPSVRGVILGRPIPHLSHLGVRARQAGVVFVCSEDSATFEKVWQSTSNAHISITVREREGLAYFGENASGATDGSMTGADGQEGTVKSTAKVARIKTDDNSSKPLSLEEVTLETASSKCLFAGKLKALAKQSKRLFQVPTGIALPHGIFQKQLAKHSKAYDSLISKFSSEFESEDGDYDSVADSLRQFIKSNIVLDNDHCEIVQKVFPNDARVMVRSSANAEDLESMSGAGLYDSVANVDVNSTEELQEAVSSVWATLWTKRAATSRASYNISHEKVSMAVLVQEMVAADLCFIGFSRDPVGNRPENIYVEVAVGMGETLASATTDGSPYRFRVNRDSLAVEDVMFASYSDALVPDSEGSGLVQQVIDYSDQLLTTNNSFREELVNRIAQTILFLEKEFGGPQDIEGTVMLRDDQATLYIVQARPQVL